METTLIWIGIIFCVSQSAMFSGLNLAFFSVTRLRLEIEAQQGNQAAVRVLKMRNDSNFLLTTILWGNVGINVLLTLLSNSVMAGVSAFIFSTFAITFFGEIFPQAYFSRHALRMASMLAPVLRFYQTLFYPLSKTSALILDKWLGAESIQYFREITLKELIRKHMEGDAEIDMVEGIGAINFLSIDDIAAHKEGEPLDPKSVLMLEFIENSPQFPEMTQKPDDPFLLQVHESNRKWIVITDQDGDPRLVMDADGFLRSALLDPEHTRVMEYCHVPLVVRNPHMPLGDIIAKLPKKGEVVGADRLEHDIVLVWGKDRRIITGTDILERLLTGMGSPKAA